MFLEAGIFLSQFIWLWRVRHVRREAKKAGKTYDEYVAEHPSKELSRSNSTTDLEAGHTDSEEAITYPEMCVTKPSQQHDADVNVSENTSSGKDLEKVALRQ
jgi:hypothetical protein